MRMVVFRSDARRVGPGAPGKAKEVSEMAWIYPDERYY
jgi:hypothetical protein